MSSHSSGNGKHVKSLRVPTLLGVLRLLPGILFSFVDPSLEMEVSSKLKGREIATQAHQAIITEIEVKERYEELGRSWSGLNKRHLDFIHRREMLEHNIDGRVYKRKLSTETVDSFPVYSTAIPLGNAYFARKLGGSVSSHHVLEKTDFDIVDNALQFLKLGELAEDALQRGKLGQAERLTRAASEALETSHKLQLNDFRRGKIPANPYKMPEYPRFSGTGETTVGIKTIEIPTLELLRSELDELLSDRETYITKWKAFGKLLWKTSNHDELFPAPHQILLHETEAHEALGNEDVITCLQNLRVAQEQQRGWIEYMEKYFTEGHQGVLDKKDKETSREEGHLEDFRLPLSEVQE